MELGSYHVLEELLKGEPVDKIEESFGAIMDRFAGNDKKKKLIAVLDHDLGGGANVYSDSLISELKERGLAILLLKYSFGQKVTKITYAGGYTKEFTVHSPPIEWLGELLSFFRPNYILVNTLVSWPRPLEIADKILKSNIPYMVFNHDYFFICPSWNLINDEGVFCNIPDFKRCERCLASNKFSDHADYYPDLYDDRSLWFEGMLPFLRKARRVVLFSQSSKKYFLKAYKGLRNAVVIEHAIYGTESFEWKQRKPHSEEELTVGVIGGGGYHKGEKLVRDLISSTLFRELPVKIVLVGSYRTFQSEHNSDERLAVTGPYERKDLPAILEKHNVDIVLIPSITPETFSLAGSEAMLLGYPLICFDLGALAERVRRYKCGIIISDASKEGIIGSLKNVLGNKKLIEELSRNAKNYLPSSTEEHFRWVTTISKK